jgi:hypothetical protein
LVWGTSPDFWSLSGSGLILGSAIWVAIAKAKVKHENHDDLERGGYVAVNNQDEPHGKLHDEEFELGDLDEDDEGSASGSGSTSAPTTPTTLTSRPSVESVNGYENHERDLDTVKLWVEPDHRGIED